ncbi:SIS domain-containing protein [Polynucleobacter sp. MWH-UH23A]|uniref:SIS domain-containing protein n=1 Tax=Polynucleobacter sp. MWH-UH23A TaxID=1855613 RepID=UPI003364EB84
MSSFITESRDYLARLNYACEKIPLHSVEVLADAMRNAWHDKRQVFIFGNGGSAGNAIHLANDFIFGVSRKFGSGLRIHALSANPAVITCLANDIGYENIFAYQLGLMSNPGDIVIALSGSGNSPNIVKALQYAAEADLQTFAILGFSGGKSLGLAKNPIHVPVDDMQISEDLQIIIGHMLMQYLYALSQAKEL